MFLAFTTKTGNGIFFFLSVRINGILNLNAKKDTTMTNRQPVKCMNKMVRTDFLAIFYLKVCP